MTVREPSAPRRALGIDLGTRRIGVAVTDTAGTVAVPRETLLRTDDAEQDRRALVEVVLASGAAVVVVGLPLSMDGSRGPAARAAEVEADGLRAALGPHGVEVELFDERLTTVTAHQVLAAGGTRSRGRRAVVDRTAAAVLLGAWLEHQRASR